MGLLIIPGLFFFLAAPLPGPPAQKLAEFSRFSKAIDRQIALTDANGAVREGVLVAAGPDSVTMKFASGTQSFSRAEIASAHRMKDGRIDGAIKGALFGFVLTALASQGYDSTTPRYLPWASVATYTGIGYLLDASETNPQTLYRARAQPAPAPPTPSLSLKFRF